MSYLIEHYNELFKKYSTGELLKDTNSSYYSVNKLQNN